MKTITLLPVKNEAWILRSTLKNISDFSDHIIIADQNSTDGSLDIYKDFEKVRVIINDNTGHDNSVRWQLLDYARKLYGSGNLIICIDADEMISPEAIEKIKKISAEEKQTVSFSFPWIQLWGSVKKYRDDCVWKDNWKAIAFTDDGKIDYERISIINDHTGRIPRCEVNMKLEQYPLLHYQYTIPKQAEIKQAWYRCAELISKGKPRKINYKYSTTSNSENITFKPVNQDWFNNLPLVSSEYNISNDWRYMEIMSWFDKYGLKFFEPLEIWYIQELREKFIKKVGQEPKIKTFPNWLIKLNNFKNKIR